MALHLPPSVTIERFTGGYKAGSDYTDLQPGETFEARNVVYGTGENIDQRLGCEKLLNQRLINSATYSANTASFSGGEPITGHYFFAKLGTTSTFNVVAAGAGIYNYTTSTAVAIRVGMTDNSQVFWSYMQIQDPRSAANELVVMTNGVDPIQVWDGSGTATTLSSFTSASAVPVAKYLLNHKERVYALNVVDTTDADAGVKVAVSGFGTDGIADPHRFGAIAGGGSFYCGGAGKQGEITGGKILNDQVYIPTRKSWFRFSPGSGNLLETANLQELQRAVGCLAPESLVDVGNFLIFLSEQGVYALDGVNFVHLSEDVDEDLFNDSNLSLLKFAKARYYKKDNQYHLYYPSFGSARNDRCLVYDLRLKVWQPPITGREVSFLSTFDTSDGIEEMLYGDYVGYLYRDHINDNDGIASTYTGTATAGSTTTLTDAAATFPTTNDGLAGLRLFIIGGTGDTESKLIASNTGTVITVDGAFTVPLDSTSQYSVAGIEGVWRSKDYDFGNADLVKLFRTIRVRPREEGNFNLTMHYIVDFKSLNQATAKDILLLENGAAWDVSLWDQARWGGASVIKRKVSLRNTNDQRLIGTHLAVRFSNRRGNQRFRITGFDLEMRPQLGKR